MALSLLECMLCSASMSYIGDLDYNLQVQNRYAGGRAQTDAEQGFGRAAPAKPKSRVVSLLRRFEASIDIDIVF